MGAECGICHRYFTGLIQHLFRAHGISRTEYENAHPDTVLMYPDAFVVPNGHGNTNWERIIPKEDLAILVRDRKMGDCRIGALYGCSEIVISRLRKIYGIEPTRRYEKMCPVNELTSSQKEMIYGTMLGDASLTPNGKYYSLVFTHSDKQKDYLLFKAKIMGTWGLKLYSHTITHIDYPGKVYFATRWASHSHPAFNEIARVCLKDGKKFVTIDWLARLTPLSIAIWYMDDGSKTRSGFVFSTDGKSRPECETIQRYFKQTWDISVSLQKSKNGRWRTYVPAGDSDKFVQIIGPHVIESMKYKLGGHKWIKI